MRHFLKSSIWVGIFTLLGVHAGIAQKSATTLAYIEKYKAIAIAEMERAKIPASITLAQGIVESGSGTSQLATKANNHFGVKCSKTWTGGTYFVVDDEKDENGNPKPSCFRAYSSPKESYEAHSDFLTDPNKAHRYGRLFDLPITDYKGWAKGLKEGGYATNPQYAEALIKVIETYELQQYDKGAAPVVTEPVATTEVGNTKVVNKLVCVVGKTGVKPFQIARAFDVDLDDLYRFNEVPKGSTFKEGQNIFLQSKRLKYKGSKSVHTVAKGETMYDIAQIYGIRIKSLYRKNRMDSPQQPKEGAKIALKKKAKKRPPLRAPSSVSAKEDSLQNTVADTSPTTEPDEPDDIASEDDGTLPPIPEEAFMDNSLEYLPEVTPKDAKEVLSVPVWVAGTPPTQPTTTTPPITTSPTTTTTTKPTEIKPIPPTTSPTPITMPTPTTTQPTTTPKPTPLPPATPIDRSKIYVVKKGDTLFGIAAKHGITIQKLRELNNLTEESVIKPDQELRVKK
jgi:LysM repeat protein